MLHIRNLLPKVVHQLAFWLSTFATQVANASPPSFTVLYSFTGGVDGGTPRGSLLADSGGNLFGTTVKGGEYGIGVVFKLSPDGTETVLASMKYGVSPEANLIADKKGNFYSTTYQGGEGCCGTAFKLSSNGKLKTLYSFCSVSGCADGSFLYSGLVRDRAHNLYGITAHGGDADCNCGVVFKLSPRGDETVLHAFTNDSDGRFSSGGLLLDKEGNLYGVTLAGGTYDNGAVFKVAADGTETLLYSFNNGWYPVGGLIADDAGNLYGTTFEGGGGGEGTIFTIAPDGAEKDLYSFKGGSDGANPPATLLRDKNGNLFGVTEYGGDLNCGGGLGCGTVFKLSASGALTVLYTFEDGADGANPVAGLIEKNGYLYGTVPYANGNGIVFSLKI